MKTQARQNVSHSRLVALGLLVLLMATSIACNFPYPSDPAACRKPDTTCAGNAPTEDSTNSFMRHEVDLINTRGCGYRNTCIWANSRAEAEQCALMQQAEPSTWRVSPGEIPEYNVAACNSGSHCCEVVVTRADRPDNARRCVSLNSGWETVDAVNTYHIGYTCKAHGSIGNTSTVDTCLQSYGENVLAQSESNAKSCVYARAEAAAPGKTVLCDWN